MPPRSPIDEAAHLRVPAARLVAEVHAGLQQLSDSYLSHGVAPLIGCDGAARGSRRAGPGDRAPGRGRGSVASVTAPGFGVEFASQFRQVLRTRLRWSLSRAGPPFPYLRWAGSPSWPAGRSSGAALRASGALSSSFSSGRREVVRAAARTGRSASPVHRVREREPRGVQELALEAERPRRPYSGSPSTGWPIAFRCARIWCVRPVSSRTRSSVRAGQVALDLEVRDAPRAARRCRSTSACARAGRGPAARRSCPRGRPGGPSTSARYSRAIRALAQRLLQRGVDGLGARHHEQPGGVAVQPVHDPGPVGVVAARDAARQRLHERPRAMPARPGARRRPAGLSTTSRCSSS